MEPGVEVAMHRLLKHLYEHEARLNHLEELIESLSDRLDSAVQELRGTQEILDDRQRRLRWEWLAEVGRSVAEHKESHE